MKVIMTLQKAGNKRNPSKGFILYGFKDLLSKEWFERWYATEKKATDFANRKKWGIKTRDAYA